METEGGVSPPALEVLANGDHDAAFSNNKSEPVHRWVPWIAGYSSQFVDATLRSYPSDEQRVLDPFAGVGTTLFQAALGGHPAVGFEINPWAAMVAEVKLRAAALDPEDIRETTKRFLSRMDGTQSTLGGVPSGFRSRIPFFSPKVERKVAVALDFVDQIEDASLRDLFRVAFGAIMVSISNYTYEPSLSSRPGAGKPLLKDADVGGILAAKLGEMAADIRWTHERLSNGMSESRVHTLDFRRYDEVESPSAFSLAVTSPPYLNNYHYVRNTRPQMYWLSLVNDPKDHKALEEANIGTFWQTARARDTITLSVSHDGLQDCIDMIRGIRAEKRAYGGPGWANYAAQYFNDTHEYLGVLHRALRPDGVAVIVVGNSIIQGVEVKTDEFLAEIAAQQGFGYVTSYLLREKRVGASIIPSSVRRGKRSDATLYESAIVLRKGV